MGYTDQLPPLVNLVVQAIMASITTLEVHKLVRSMDLETLNKDNTDSGPLVLDTLGIIEWLNVSQIAKQGGVLKALTRLWQYIGSLASFETQDRWDFEKASATI